MNSYKILGIDGTKITVEWTINGVKSTDTIDGRHLLYVEQWEEVTNIDGEKNMQLKEDIREDTLEAELMRQLTVMVNDSNKEIPIVEQAQDLIGKTVTWVAPIEVTPEVMDFIAPVDVAPEVTDLVGKKVDIVVPEPAPVEPEVTE